MPLVEVLVCCFDVVEKPEFVKVLGSDLANENEKVLDLRKHIDE